MSISIPAGCRRVLAISVSITRLGSHISDSIKKQHIHYILESKDKNKSARLPKISINHPLQNSIFCFNINNAFLFEESSHCGRESCTF